jgi:hypothetical protein
MFGSNGDFGWHQLFDIWPAITPEATWYLKYPPSHNLFVREEILVVYICRTTTENYN